MSSLSLGSNPIRYPGYFAHKLQIQENPHLVLTHDIVRNIKTLHFQINTLQPLSPNREYLQKSMKGYFGVMTNSPCSSCYPNGNGEQVGKHCLWQPKNTTEPKDEPLWHLRVSVLKDQEARGDCQSRRFAFKSLHHLTHAANQLDEAFKSFDIKKCGVESPDAMGDRVNDGRSENITIEFESDTSLESWKEFMARLKALEDEWEHEGMSVL
ncbi:uncharacterized protein RAG0_10180 [Rhynchosporium agropyri]|uniref:Uncharacterized protein n=1 Tax=Rhynchosporium agropyri TaxID=914238 RepID=A0A1E1KYU1_9HELO|nr:uncharacterized protein RAG0_10180 [Rhynchosporium agropyri]